MKEENNGKTKKVICSTAIDILHCSDYVVLPKEADKSIFSSLRNQVSVTVDKTVLSMGDKTEAAAKTKVELPPTLEVVENLKDKTSNSKIGGVTITYSSTNKKVATVDKTGAITAVGKGTDYVVVSIGKVSEKVKVVVK